MSLLLFLIPFGAGFAGLYIADHGVRRKLLIGTAVLHFALTCSIWFAGATPVTSSEWFAVDPLGILFLSVLSSLFLAASIYSQGYLAREYPGVRPDFVEPILFANSPEQKFTSCMLFFVGAMTLVVVSQHLAFLWVGLKLATLSSAPIIYFHKHHRSLEAMWKYILICSVGMALALLGLFFMAAATGASGMESGRVNLTVFELLQSAHKLDRFWLRLSFLFCLVGFGTKMGLVPFHTWLPDTYSESPSVLSMLLSGAMLNCSFLGLLRIHQVLSQAGEGEFSSGLLIVFGIASLVVALIFIIGQRDFKRLLAYSSIEHMGLLTLAVGLGRDGAFASLLHAVNHSFGKAMMFLLAGNILGVFNTRKISRIQGILKVTPVTGSLWVVGLFILSGAPPFGTFISEFLIIRAALASGHVALAAALLIFLAAIFIAMSSAFLGMAQGQPSSDVTRHVDSTGWRVREPLVFIVPPAALGLVVLLLGLTTPNWLKQCLTEGSMMISGR